MARSRDIFTTIHTEGALLPPDLLQRIVEGDGDLDGLTPASYHLSGERLNEATNRAWNRLQGAWAAFQSAQEGLPSGDLGTTITRERWLLPLFAALDYGRLPTARAVEIDGRSYPISHNWGNVPIHLVSYQLDLDKRASGVAGAATASPHSLLQVYLNRSDEVLWGFLSNGHLLRILRDNVSLTRQAYVEFDLEAMMEGEVYADFVLLYLLCHQSRVEAERPSDFWLERWMQAAQEQGKRALDTLCDGVQSAIECLGVGFIAHPANHNLREKLREGELNGGLNKQEYYRQLLRLVYRLLFLFTAEDRGLLHPKGVDEATQQRYHDYYSTRRLRHMAERVKGTRHRDLFEGLQLVMRLLSDEGLGYDDTHRATLGLPALGGWLFRESSVADVIDCAISNRDLLDAVRALAFTLDEATRTLRPVDYKNLGPEELGSVYESLLELHPQINLDARLFSLATAAGHERKTTGSYYTPDALVQELIKSALDPVIEERKHDENPEAALLDLKICDPACGSGHFLIAAARRTARALAAIRTGEEEPPPTALRKATRDVIGRCIYGVDINPMAVELCKVNLWIESVDPGKPLSFLDHRILCGNSLLGTTPRLMWDGVPDDAFRPIEGDDREYVNYFRKKNRTERRDVFDPDRGAQMMLFDTQPFATHARLAASMTHINTMPSDTVEEVREQERAYRELEESFLQKRERFLANLWCAIFVWEKTGDPHTEARLPPPTALLYDRLYRAENPWEIDRATEEIERETRRLANRYQFFHWHIGFPDAFVVPEQIEDAENEQTGWNGGFDCVLGNPPWERIKLQEKEWFAERSPEIAAAPNTAARKRLIKALMEDDPYLYSEFLADKRKAEGESHFARMSNRYPLTGRGDINTYQLFAGLNRSLVAGTGRAGFIVPSGIATDDTTKYYFQVLMENHQLAALFDFENRNAIFEDVHRSYKFCLLTLTGLAAPVYEAEFVFFALEVPDIYDREKRFTLSARDIALINPNTRTSPTFRTRRDADLTKAIYQRVPILVQEPEENPWGITFSTMFHMSNDSHLFRTRDQLELAGYVLEGNRFVRGGDVFLPLYEAKMIATFDHRSSEVVLSETAIIRQGQPSDLSVEEHQSPFKSPAPRYWVRDSDVLACLKEGFYSNWFLGFANVTSATNHRTMIISVLPQSGVGHSMPLILFPRECLASQAACFLANLASFVFDYIGRQKLGGINYTFYILYQLPTLLPDTYTTGLLAFVTPRVLELTYTAWDLQHFAQDVEWDGPPFVWDEERRFLLRCELDALYFHLYQIARDDVDYIMETFPIVRRKDEQAYGEYRTKRVILQMYDEMAALPRIAVPHPKGLDEEYLVPDVSQFETWLSPPPADPSVAHPERD